MTCPTHSRTLILSRGAEGDGDDGLGVSLQGAGAARHRPHPEHGLWLVDDVENLLCLHCLPCQGLLQWNDDLSIVEEEGQRHRLILEVKLQERWQGAAPGTRSKVRPGPGSLTCCSSALHTSCSLSGVMLTGTSKGEPSGSPASSRNWIRSRSTSSVGSMLCGTADSAPVRGRSSPAALSPRQRQPLAGRWAAPGEPRSGGTGNDPPRRPEEPYRRLHSSRETAGRPSPCYPVQPHPTLGSTCGRSPSDPAPVPSRPVFPHWVPLPAPLTAAMCPYVPRGPEAAALRGEGGRRRWTRRCCPPVAGGGSPGFGTAGCVPLKYCPAGLEKDSTLPRKPGMKQAVNSALLVSSAAQLLKECVIRAQTWGL